MSWKGDPNAIHTVVDGEIAGLSEKATPVDADLVIIEDSENGNAKAKAKAGNLPSSGGGGGGSTRFGEQPLTTPPSTGWSWVNQGSATETVESEGSIVVVTPAVGSNNLLGRVRSYTAPGTATARLNARPAGQTHSGVGVWFRESSTGKVSAIYIKPNGDLVIEDWTNPTTFSASVTSISPGTGNLPLWLEIEDDNTDLFYRVGRDGFEGTFYEITSVGRTSFMAGGPDEYGWMLRDNNAAKAGALSSWATS